MKQGKIWGTTQELFNNGIVSINHLKIKQGGYCSEHCHLRKSNLFFVISGKLSIMIWQGKKKDETIIRPGESTAVGQGMFHKFRAMTEVECLEIYETRLKGEDIVRRTKGGIA